MGKANRKKIELIETGEMVGLIQTLKDIADSKYYSMLGEKEKLRRFGEMFVEFFRLISLTGCEHPLIKNDNKKVGIVVATGEGSFLGKFNGSILSLAERQQKEYEEYEYIAVGARGAERLEQYTPDLKVFSGFEEIGIYEMAIQLKDYLIEKIMDGHYGKIIVVYSWPKTQDIQRPRIVNLLPCIDLASKQAEYVEEFEKVIEESDSRDTVGMLAQIWVTSRLYEIFLDLLIAAAAAQASFLDDSVDKMKKEEVKARFAYRKAKKGDIDKSLRETFSARLIANG